MIKLVGLLEQQLDDLCENGVEKVSREASGISIALEIFDFIYCLHLMNEVMGITDFIYQILQKKDLDILSVVDFVSVTKEKLQILGDNGLDDLIKKVELLCSKYGIIVSDMSVPYKRGIRDSDKNITNEHYFSDKQLAELNNRFAESSMELLVLSASFHPCNDFRAFNVEYVCKLASKFYTSDFLGHDLDSLRTECEFFLQVIQKDRRFRNMTSIIVVCRLLVELGRTSFCP